MFEFDIPNMDFLRETNIVTVHGNQFLQQRRVRIESIYKLLSEHQPANNMSSPNQKSKISSYWRSPFEKWICRATESYRAIYYKAKESLGHSKREIIVYQVEQARDSFEIAKNQFQNALDQFSDVTHFEGGDLELMYRKLKVEYELSRNKSNAVSERISAIEKVANSLFEEWHNELSEYSSRSLRGQSRKQLRMTQRQYGRLIKMMHHAEAKIQPVLAAFHDQVLFIKHNINAKAISSLHNEFVLAGIDTVTLISSMEKSISEANAFMNSLVDIPALPRFES